MTHREAIMSIWTGLCSVYVRETKVNEANGRDEPIEVLKLENVPCRLSYKTIASTSENSEAELVHQAVKLFLLKEVEIPPGSKLVVTQEGKTAAYVKSGEAAVYSVHQEIMLELFKEWA